MGSSLDPEVAALGDGTLRRFLEPTARYALTRFALLRLLGLVYFVAFASLARQLDPLLGSSGLLPIADLLPRVARATGSTGAAFGKVPTLFWLSSSDLTLHATCWIGVALSLAVLFGVTNALVQAALWASYLSFVQVGQIFYGYGWESQLCETGFLAIFLCPVRTWRPFASAPHPIPIWLFRWLIARIMLGAGLIKIRGDACWRDLTCLAFHYETQPVPSPVSWLLHQAPLWAHRVGVVFNHLVELVAPFFAFGPRRARLVAGSLFVAFQVTLIVSGNLSFLNWLTIVPALACFDDEALLRAIPAALSRRFTRGRADRLTDLPVPPRARWSSYAVAFVVGVLSVNPLLNLLSRRQRMNTSFDPLMLVNTYGAFGSVGRERNEVVLEGTSDAVPDESARWTAYELPCKPGDVHRRPCVITPWHYRLDWQLWFAPFGDLRQQPWMARLVYKLLTGDRTVAPLFAVDPFPTTPPRFVRVTLWRYRFTRLGDGSAAWWTRERLGMFLRPVDRDDPELLRFLAAYGWAPPGVAVPPAPRDAPAPPDEPVEDDDGEAP